MGGSREMSAFRAAMRSALEAQAGKRKAQAVLAESNLSRAWEIYKAYKPVDFYANPNARREIRRRSSPISSASWSSMAAISVNQGAFLGKLIEQIDNRAERAAQRVIENEAAANCPTGRVIVTGTVLSTKLQDSQFGTVLKMLVRDDSGFKVWCTVPASENVEKGDKITFTVSVEPSRDDPKFGFGKRPAKLKQPDCGGAAGRARGRVITLVVVDPKSPPAGSEIPALTKHYYHDTEFKKQGRAQRSSCLQPLPQHAQGLWQRPSLNRAGRPCPRYR